MKLEQAARQALEALELCGADDMAYVKSEKAITALREALAEPDIEEMTLTQIAARHEQAEQEPEVWYCPDCGTLSELQVKCCPDWIRSRKVPKNFAITCKATFDRNGQAEQEPQHSEHYWLHEINNARADGYERGYVAAKKLYTEQAEQEPVAWGYFDADGSFMDALDRQHGAYQTPLYAAPVQQAEQKPIGYVIEDNDYEGSKIWAEPINGCCLPVYLAPVRTKDLTDDEIEEIWSFGNGAIYFARAVIAADREKNRGTA